MKNKEMWFWIILIFLAIFGTGSWGVYWDSQYGVGDVFSTHTEEYGYQKFIITEIDSINVYVYFPAVNKNTDMTIERFETLKDIDAINKRMK